MSIRIAVLVSGNGTNLQAMIDAVEAGKIDGQIVGVISNNPEAFALTRAQDANIKIFALSPEPGESREAYDQRLSEILQSLEVDLIVLAGFMRILSPHFVKKFTGKILNIHPSLLPKYPGMHTHMQVLKNKDSEHGCTIHFVNEDLDAGPIIAQASIPVKKADTLETLTQKVRHRELKLYPQVVQWFAQGKLRLDGNAVVLNDITLPTNGVQVLV